MTLLLWKRMDGGSKPLIVLLLALSAGHWAWQTSPAAETKGESVSSSAADPTALVARGHSLFLMNCAHCHGQDATGDECPNLHGVKKSDARIGVLIKNGISGEMPKFGAKLTDGDVQALIAFIRSLR